MQPNTGITFPGNMDFRVKASGNTKKKLLRCVCSRLKKIILNIHYPYSRGSDASRLVSRFLMECTLNFLSETWQWNKFKPDTRSINYSSHFSIHTVGIRGVALVWVRGAPPVICFIYYHLQLDVIVDKISVGRFFGWGEKHLFPGDKGEGQHKRGCGRGIGNKERILNLLHRPCSVGLKGVG